MISVLSVLSGAEILHMHIGAEADVVGQVPAIVIRVGVNHDVVGVPQPAVAEGYVIGGNVPIPAVEPEAAGTSAAKMPYVPAAKAAGKAAMREGMVVVVVGIPAARVMTDPGLVIHVRDVGVAFLVAVVAIRLGRMGRAGVGLWPTLGSCLVGSTACRAGFSS